MMPLIAALDRLWSKVCDDSDDMSHAAYTNLSNGVDELRTGIAELTRENERLTQLRMAASAHATQMLDRAEAAEARVAELEKDAARYRWLRDTDSEDLCVRVRGDNPIHPHLWAYYKVTGGGFDATIDAAIDALAGPMGESDGR